MIRSISELRSDDASIVGAKAANLGELMNLGLPVPEGSVLLFDAPNIAQSEGMAQEYPDLDEDVETQVLAAFDALGCDQVSVRSSATVEDAMDASYAGLFQTFLWISRDGLIDACRKCLSSAHSARVELYRSQRGLVLSDIKMPVIIQRMLEPDMAGVCFTEHPVTGEEGEFLIEIAAGVGEAVVSGFKTPDAYLFDHDIDRITSVTPGDAGRQRDSALLSRDRRELIEHVANTCKLIHEHFGTAQDIEFAIEGSQLYFLQARPLVKSQSIDLEGEGNE